ncbi:MAG: methylenetetrahydrofolate reductase [NAD(P)H] [Gammaproteobacteria bacterium]|nr:MAG: methylenetetrahydrofolate reductase [NAD(P)H] [Gammaproteobacteria bacterium]
MNTEKTFSFELFPPKTEKGMANLQETVRRLNERRPAFFSCTYGAGGSTRDRTFATVDWLVSQGIETAPHLTCIGLSVAEALQILDRYRRQGIRRIVALRGDPPSGTGLAGGEMRHASELVQLIREHHGDHFHIEVAAYPEMHPQAPNFFADLDHFKEKMAAGANSAITQYFYNVDAYTHFIDQCLARGMEAPVVPGIMPITNYGNLARFSDACGAEIPRWIRKRLESYADDVESIRAFGLDVVTELCEKLLAAGAPGLHFYTMNQADPTLSIWDRLGL